jgi:CRP-like cAMP-binding protein/uncharacterized protein (DUF2225 family)
VSNQALLGIIVKAISGVGLFKSMPVNILEKIAELAKVDQYKKGAAIFKEGEMGDRFYIVVNGRVKIRRMISAKKETILYTAGNREVFGDMSLMDGLPRSADAIAEEDSVLFYIERPVFLQFLRTNPDAALKLLETMSLRLRETNEMLLTNKENVQDITASDEGTAESAEEEMTTVPTSGEDKTGGKAVDEMESFASYKSAVKTDEYVDNTVKWTYSKKFVCPLCAGGIQSLVAKTDSVQEESVDTDMCTRYRLVNPTFYYVVVCRDCGYAFLESAMEKFRPAKAKMLKQKMPEIRSNEDFSGVRTIDDAIVAYLLAITCQTLAGAKNAVIGRLHMLLSCLFRQKGLHKEEIENMKQALAYLEKSYSYDASSDARAELNLIYLIGEIYGRLGQPGKAVEWFKQIVIHPERNSNPYIVNLARERWQDFKLQKTGKKENDTGKEQ